jgi:hypothetical protein
MGRFHDCPWAARGRQRQSPCAPATGETPIEMQGDAQSTKHIQLVSIGSLLIARNGKNGKSTRTCALAGRTVDAHASVRLARDAIDLAQSQPGTAHRRLGCKKGSNALRNAFSVIPVPVSPTATMTRFWAQFILVPPEFSIEAGFLTCMRQACPTAQIQQTQQPGSALFGLQHHVFRGAFGYPLIPPSCQESD